MRSQRFLSNAPLSRARRAQFISRGVVFMLLLTLLTVPLAALRAQDNRVTITIGLPQFVETIITPELLAQFEEQNPDIKVQTIPGGFPGFPPVTSDLDKHFDEVNKYMSAADVNFMGSGNLTPEAAEAGYFLDLSPLTSTDTELNPDDFFPDIWQSVQWDGKVWMMPVSADVISLAYNKEAFDKAGIAYPTGAWTVDDLDKAARALAEKDADGKVTKPGLMMFGDYTGLLIRSLAGEGFYDGSVTPNAPSFNKPSLEPILTTLAKLQQDGVFSTNFSGQVGDIPMRITGSIGLSGVITGDNAPGASLLPGGKAGIEAEGFVISSGTLYPEQAYKLVKFLSFAPSVANNFLSATPARQSLVGVQPPPSTSSDDSTSAAVAVLRPDTPEIKAMIAEALQNGIPASEVRYGDYISDALAKINSDNLDAQTALQNAETLAVSNQKAADDKRTNLIVSVATPIPQTVLGDNEISLKFGMLSFVSPMPNRDQWDQVIQDFVASDPQVGEIKLDTGINQPEQ